MDANLEKGATDVDGAASRLAGLFAEREAPTEDQKKAEVTSQAKETPEGDTKTAEETNDRRFKAKLGDTEVEFDLVTEGVDLDLIPKGLMMEADYRKKTSEVAENRKALESKFKELDDKLSDAAEVLQFEIDNLESEEMKELRDSDPEEFWKRADKIKSKVERLDKMRKSRQEELNEERQKLLEKEMSELPSAIPDWLDDDLKLKEMKAIGEMLSTEGFEEQEIASMADRRFIKMLRKAMLFDKIQSQDLSHKKVKEPPKSATPESPSRLRKDNNQNAKDRLRKSGRMVDAQEAIKATLFK